MVFDLKAELLLEKNKLNRLIKHAENRVLESSYNIASEKSELDENEPSENEKKIL